MQIPVYEKRGYLNEDFRFFSISGKGLPEMDYHYHEFHKIIFLRDGKLGYSIEGCRYELKKNDIVLIPAGCIHRPEIEDDAFYSRDVLYIAPEFLQTHSTDSTELEICFSQAEGTVARTAGDTLITLQKLFFDIEEIDEESFGSDVLCRSLVLQLLVNICRWIKTEKTGVEGIANDRKILNILQYVNENIGNDLSIDGIAEKFFISKYHMMRRFRAETGYTVHSYITNKRLLYARQLLNAGEAATDVCFKCGFNDYSTFSRAYRKMFECSPAGRKKKNGEE